MTGTAAAVHSMELKWRTEKRKMKNKEVVGISKFIFDAIERCG